MKKRELQEIALQRIYRLFELAEKSSKKALADRYVFLAKKIGLTYNTRIPKKLRLKHCKKCGSFLKNTKIRVDRKGWKTTCPFCSTTKKTGFKTHTNTGAKALKKSSGKKRVKTVPNKKKGAKGGKPL